MSLRAIAEADMGSFLADGAYGFGWPITVTDPAGLVGPLTGFSSDISQVIDPDTGQAVSGRLATVALRISALTTAGFTTLPRAIADTTSKPWVIQFNDINGNAHKFKVAQSNPDRTIGILICQLEVYK